MSNSAVERHDEIKGKSNSNELAAVAICIRCADARKEENVNGKDQTLRCSLAIELHGSATLNKSFFPFSAVFHGHSRCDLRNLMDEQKYPPGYK